MFLQASLKIKLLGDGLLHLLINLLVRLIKFIMKERILFFVLSFFIVLTDDAAKQSRMAKTNPTLESRFEDPPVIAPPKALWPWVNDNFSLSQITNEMEQARQKGMGAFDIWHVGTTITVDKLVPDGPVTKCLDNPVCPGAFAGGRVGGSGHPQMGNARAFFPDTLFHQENITSFHTVNTNLN